MILPKVGAWWRWNLNLVTRSFGNRARVKTSPEERSEFRDVGSGSRHRYKSLGSPGSVSTGERSEGPPRIQFSEAHVLGSPGSRLYDTVKSDPRRCNCQ